MKIFCCGSWTREKRFTSTECYAPLSDIWILICHTLRPNIECDAAAINRKFTVIGGWAYDKGCLNTLWVVDSTDKNTEWMDTRCISFSCCAFSITKIEDKICSCRGRSAAKKLDDVEFLMGKAGEMVPSCHVLILMYLLLLFH